MATIQYNYPHGLTDNQIESSIKEYSHEIFEARGNINTTLSFVPLIQLGQSELQSRQTKRVTWLTMIVSFTSLLISGAALFVSYDSSRASSEWEKSQLQALNEINASIGRLNREMAGTVNAANASDPIPAVLASAEKPSQGSEEPANKRKQ